MVILEKKRATFKSFERSTMRFVTIHPIENSVRNKKVRLTWFLESFKKTSNPKKRVSKKIKIDRVKNRGTILT